MNQADMQLKDILLTYKGAKIIDQEGPNIMLYKPRRSSTQKPHQDSFEDEPRKNRSSLSASASPLNTPKKKKKKKKKAIAQKQTMPKGQPASEPRKTQEQVKYSSAKAIASREASFAAKPGLKRVYPQPDIEQPSSQRQLMSQPRSRTTHSVPSSPSPKNNPKPLCCGDHLGYRMRSMKESLLRFKGIKFVQLALAIYIIVLTYADIGWPGGLRNTETGLIVDQDSPERTEKGLILINGTERAIAASTLFQVVCIGVARVSAWLMYPALVLVFISKFRATISFLSTTPLAMYMHSDSHEVHIYCGWTILVFATIHTLAHVARWAEQGNLSLLISHFSGVSGLFIITSCLLICIPMTIFRERIKFEVRKCLHYLFLVFAIALCFHTPTSAIPNGGFTFWVFGTLLVWYFLDFLFCYFFMTEKIETTKFSVLPSGVRMTMDVSERFQKMGAHGGVGYVCLPWVSKNQWHAFSLFENPSNPAERQIFIQKTGDWTSKVHQILQRDTVRPAWIHGPFPSPYDNAIEYDNQILVASGIGITPALSVIRAHKDSRRINLIWAVRDPHLLDFFIRHLYLDHQGWNLIFYTGKEKLNSKTVEDLTNTNICVIDGRPKLGEVIPNIIFGIESSLGLPERYNPDTRAIASEMLTDRLSMSEGAEDLSCYASELGFHLPTGAIDEKLSSNMRTSGYSKKARRRASESIMEHLAIGFRPWDSHPAASDYVKKLDKKMVIPTWGMLYCGGAKPVLKDLRQISDEYQVGLHVESFAW